MNVLQGGDRARGIFDAAARFVSDGLEPKEAVARALELLDAYVDAEIKRNKELNRA